MSCKIVTLNLSFVFMLLIIFLLGFSFYTCKTVKEFGAPQNLRCEYRKNPLGIDDLKPRLCWYVNDVRRGAKQSAYQILVASSSDILDRDEGDLWDSGKIDSDQSVHVVYEGAPLKSHTRYFWKVRTWDAQGQPSPFSAMAWLEMGLLVPNDWQANWVGKEVQRPEPDPEQKWPWGYWIWHPTEIGIDKLVYFRKVFFVPDNKKIKTALIRTTADNYFTAFLNGKELGSGTTWTELYDFEVGVYLQPGKNLIAVKAANSAGEVCGLILSMKVVFDDGSDMVINSDESWKTMAEEETGWQKLNFNDHSWGKIRIIERYGESQWGKIDPKDIYYPPNSIMVRKEFEVAKSIHRARAYVTALGSYVLYLNGKRVGNDIFTPGWTDYPTRIQYQTYDVTEFLHKNRNAVGAIMGNMWWSGGLGWRGSYFYSDGPLHFLLQLEIEYKDGTHERIISDQTWKTHDSPILRDHIYHGETYDARLEQEDWAQPGFDDKDWQPVLMLKNETGKLVAQQGPTIQITQQIHPVNISEPDSGTYIFDMGQNMVGWVRLNVQGPAGTKVILRFAELLKEDGTLYRDNLRTARATDTYILKGTGMEVWEPHFTYHGFRYVEISGYPGKPTKEAILGKVVHSAAPVTFSFSSSNKLMDKIHHNITWGQRGNMYSVPTDCPQRDERLGWMGDAQIFAPTACYNMDMALFFTKWMHDISDCQDSDGAVHDVNPAIVVSGPAKPGWGDAAVVIPWVVYHFYGDKRIIEENYHTMAGWVGYMKDHSKNYIYDRSGYGDWIAVIESPKKPIGAAYFYYSTKLLAEMAGIIGKDEDQKKYNQLADNIAKAFHKKYFDLKTNQYEGATQTANLLPLALGITPDDVAPLVLDNIVKDLKERKNHISTGFLGTYYLLPVLSAYGEHELAYTVASQNTYPSWGYMVEKGATTIWELWNSDTEGPSMNSRNHFALGSVGEWFYTWLAGIRRNPDYPGFKKSIIAPKPVGDLTWAEGRLETIYGTLNSRWELKEDQLKMKVTIPPNTSAMVHIPNIDGNWSNIQEGETVLVQNGQTVGTAVGLQLVEWNDSETIFEVGSGSYNFIAK